MFHNYPKLFEDPNISYPINDMTLGFDEYINKTKNIIATHRQDLNQNSQLIIEANTPFELKPPQSNASNTLKKGVLLIHGLLDTPFLMKDIGKKLQEQGMLVRSILLPGHATVPGALLNVKYEDWLQAVRYGVASFKNEVDEIYLAGFSTGASLSIYYALTESTPIAGIISFSPAFKINSPFAFTSNWNQRLGTRWKRANWFFIGEEIDYTKYCSLPFNAVHQVYRLTRALQKINPDEKPKCPLFMALSYDDLIVCSLATINYFLQHSHPLSRMILYTSSMHAFKDSRILLRSSIYPTERIVNFSHISIPTSPTNFHYGITGDFPLASHVGKDDRYIYGALDKPKKVFYNMMYKLKLTPFIHRRLTFNPDFDFMLEGIMKFIHHPL